MRRNTEQDFWKNVDRAPGHGPNGDCWIWIGHTDKDGYGHFRFGGKMVRCHRLVLSFINGEVSPDKLVCHKCDNPPCVNPDHLFLGSSLDNQRDMSLKGRRRIIGKPWTRQQREKIATRFKENPELRARGERSGRAKLTNDEVIAMRKMRTEGISYGEIAKQYGVTKRAVRLAVNRLTWQHI